MAPGACGLRQGGTWKRASCAVGDCHRGGGCVHGTHCSAVLESPPPWPGVQPALCWLATGPGAGLPAFLPQRPRARALRGRTFSPGGGQLLLGGCIFLTGVIARQRGTRAVGLTEGAKAFPPVQAAAWHSPPPTGCPVHLHSVLPAGWKFQPRCAWNGGPSTSVN